MRYRVGGFKLRDFSGCVYNLEGPLGRAGTASSSDYGKLLGRSAARRPSEEIDTSACERRVCWRQIFSSGRGRMRARTAARAGV